MTPEKKRTAAKALSLIVIMGGSIVVAGMVTMLHPAKRQSHLKRFHSAVALHTAILFVLLGAGLLCL